MGFYIGLGFVGVILTAFSQVILKIGARKKADSSFLKYFINIYTFLGYLMLFTVTLINLYIFKFLNLKYMVIFLPSSYILVFILSHFVLREKIKKNRLIGFFIILSGIVLFNF